MSPDTWHWVAFGASIACLLAIDLFLHRSAQQSSERAAVLWSVIWIAAGLAFSSVAFTISRATGEEYLAAYAMEKSLSLDNMFVFMLIFRSLKVPTAHQHTALAWGIFGALAFRAVFIFVGASALERWDWVRYLFGGLLVLAALQALREDPNKGGDSRMVQWLSKHVRVSTDADDNRFFVKEHGRWLATPLLLSLLAVELSDIAFAIDSVPAALSVTRDRFVVYSSNAFAILGLRALYLAVEAYLARLHYLRFGLAAVLLFAAFKLLAGEAVDIQPLLSVLIVAVCIVAAAGASLVARMLKAQRA
jgi:tellurite resistance protein TerC